MVSQNGFLVFRENDDFVNREAQLKALWQVIQGTTPEQIVLIRGESGMGKTRLLGECLAQCRDQSLTCGWIDFAEPLEQGYLSFILQLWEQIGTTGFEAVEECIQKLSTFGRWETANAAAVPMTPTGLPNVPPPNAAIPQQVTATTGTIGDNAQVAIGVGNTVIRAETVQHVALIINHDDWWMQSHVQTQLTAAFLAALTKCTAEGKVILFLDSWKSDSPTTELRQWLVRTLFQWVDRKLLPKLILIVAGHEGMTLPRLTQPPIHLELAELDATAIRTYWGDLRHLPEEEVEDIIKYSQGFPLLLVLLANRYVQRRQSTFMMMA